MTNILLTRHGHVDNPKQIFYGPDIRLSERGKRQVLTLAKDIEGAGMSPIRIVHSPYVRTTESAELLATALNIQQVSGDDRLVEWQVGDWYGKPLADFYAYTKYAEHPDRVLPSDIEPLTSCAARVQQTLAGIVEQNPGSLVLVVSHREPLASAIMTYQKNGFAGIRELHFPIASSWEGTFVAPESPDRLALRFDRSSIE